MHVHLETNDLLAQHLDYKGNNVVQHWVDLQVHLCEWMSLVFCDHDLRSTTSNFSHIYPQHNLNFNYLQIINIIIINLCT